MSQNIDVSNYTQPFTPDQIAYLKSNGYGVCIGIQRTPVAQAFQQQCIDADLPYDFYTDLPGRDISFIPAGTEVYIDIEPGCFQSAADVNAEIHRLQKAGLKPAIYGNATSIEPIRKGSDWSGFPLWYANWPTDHHIPDISEFVPFAGWTKPEGWQYSTLGVAGINCDLSVLFEPVKPPHFVRFESMWYLSDGSSWPITGSVDAPA